MGTVPSTSPAPPCGAQEADPLDVALRVSVVAPATNHSAWRCGRQRFRLPSGAVAELAKLVKAAKHSPVTVEQVEGQLRRQDLHELEQLADAARRAPEVATAHRRRQRGDTGSAFGLDGANLANLTEPVPRRHAARWSVTATTTA
jgi:hypothetical protein